MKDIILLFIFQALFIGTLIFLLHKKINPQTYWVAVVIVFLVPFTYIVGVFASSFDNNMCYSDTIKSLVSLVEHSIESKDPQRIDHLVKVLNELPLYGYETECTRVFSYLNEAESKIKP